MIFEWKSRFISKDLVFKKVDSLYKKYNLYTVINFIASTCFLHMFTCT